MVGLTSCASISCLVLGWYVGHTAWNFPMWRLLPVMGRWGSSCRHRHPSLQASSMGMGDRVVPMETGSFGTSKSGGSQRAALPPSLIKAAVSLNTLPRRLGFLHHGRAAAQRSVLASRMQRQNRGAGGAFPPRLHQPRVAAYVQFPRPATPFPVLTAHLAAPSRGCSLTEVFPLWPGRLGAQCSYLFNPCDRLMREVQNHANRETSQTCLSR